MRLSKWRKQNFALNYSNNKKIIFNLLLNLLLALGWFFAVPYFVEIPLAGMFVLQPDLGYTLLIGVIVGLSSSCVQYILKSNLKKDNLLLSDQILLK